MEYYSHKKFIPNAWQEQVRKTTIAVCMCVCVCVRARARVCVCRRACSCHCYLQKLPKLYHTPVHVTITGKITLLRCPYTPMCNHMHLHLCARYGSRCPCQSSVDYGNTKTPSVHLRLGSTTLSQLAPLVGSNQNFPFETNPRYEVFIRFPTVQFSFFTNWVVWGT